MKEHSNCRTGSIQYILKNSTREDSEEINRPRVDFKMRKSPMLRISGERPFQSEAP